MQAVTAKGQTPASNSPSDIATAIGNISTEQDFYTFGNTIYQAFFFGAINYIYSNGGGSISSGSKSINLSAYIKNAVTTKHMNGGCYFDIEKGNSKAPYLNLIACFSTSLIYTAFSNQQFAVTFADKYSNTFSTEQYMCTDVLKSGTSIVCKCILKLENLPQNKLISSITFIFNSLSTQNIVGTIKAYGIHSNKMD